jgi:multidrug efflux system outer membrane protein
MRPLSLLLLGATLLGGCLVGPNYERPDTPEHAAYRQDTTLSDSARAEIPSVESVADLRWWELYQDSVLQGLITTALENNRDLQVALARIEEARAAVGFSRADLYPFVDGVAGGAVSGNTEDDFTASGVLAGTVFWEVDLFGRIRRTNEAALNEYLASEQAYRSVTIALVAQVAELYLVLRDLDNRLAISEATVTARRESADIIQARFDAGVVSEVDVNQAEIQLSQAEAAVESFLRLRVQTENAISVLLGQPPMDIERGIALREQVLPPDLPPGLPSELLERRPDILVAERQLAAQTARIGAAEAIKYPSLTMSADMGASFASITTGFLNLGANLIAPLFNSGKNQRRVEIEVARTRQLLHSYEQAVLNAFREVEDAMVAVHRYQAEYEHRRRQVEAAENAADLSWIRYQGGWTSFLEVLEVQRSLFSAQLQASETLQLRHTSLVQLYKALGGGWTPVEVAELDGVEADEEPAP